MNSDHMATPELGMQGDGVGGQPRLSIHKIHFFTDNAEITVACTARSWEGWWKVSLAFNNYLLTQVIGTLGALPGRVLGSESSFYYIRGHLVRS